MKKLSFLMIIIAMLSCNYLKPAAQSSTVRVTSKTTPSFIWRGQRVQKLPPEKYSAWYRNFQDYQMLLPKYKELAQKSAEYQKHLAENFQKLFKVYSSVDTHPFYERVVKPYKGMHYAKESGSPVSFGYESDYPTIPLRLTTQQTPTQEVNDSKNRQNYSSDLEQKLPKLEKIFKFHSSFQNWKKTQQQQLMEKIDPIVQEYNPLIQKLQQKPLDPVLIKLVRKKQQRLVQRILQERSLQKQLQEKKANETRITSTGRSPEGI